MMTAWLMIDDDGDRTCSFVYKERGAVGFLLGFGMEFLVKERSWNARNRHLSFLVTE